MLEKLENTIVISIKIGAKTEIARALTLGARCLKFLCVVGMMHGLSHFSRESAKFMSHDGVTKTRQEAGF